MLKFGTEVSIVDLELNNFMKIEQNFPTIARQNRKSFSAARTRKAGQAVTTFEQKTQAEKAMTTAADVRAEVVARGKMLIADPNYPSQAQIKKMSRLLAAHLK